REEAEAVAKKMDGTKLIIVRQAGEGGQLYGSVTARDIGDGLKEAGYAVDRGQVLLNTPIKTLGTFRTAVKLHPEVKIDVEFTVARSVEEANLIAEQAADFLERSEDAEKLAATSAEERAESEAKDPATEAADEGESKTEA
ncbi:MAG: 50S ribosomal L9 C-terminal domain-containing protein, partial [Rhodospirillaceae bacterium]